MVSIAFFPLLKKSSPPGEQVCALNIFIAQKKCNLKNIAKASFKRKNLKLKAIEFEISFYSQFYHFCSLCTGGVAWRRTR